MNLFTKMWRATKWGSAPPRDPVVAAWFGGRDTHAGVTVTPEEAIKLNAVYAAVKVIAETVAWIPLVLYRRTADDGREKDRDHPLFTLLRERPNRWQRHPHSCN